MLSDIIIILIGIFCVLYIVKRGIRRKIVLSAIMIALFDSYIVFHVLSYLYIRYKNTSIDVTFALTDYLITFRYILDIIMMIFIILISVINLIKLKNN